VESAWNVTIKTKAARLNVRVTHEEKREMRKRARMAGVTVGEWVRRAIAAAMVTVVIVLYTGACEMAQEWLAK
jgi:hypothetical protein